MKILLISIKSSMMPVGIAYISAALKRAGHEVECHVFYDDQILADKLNQNSFDFVATGGLSSEYKQIKTVSDITKKTNNKLIIGGGIITSEPELMARALNPDYAIVGEGEECIVELLACLSNNGDVSKIDGIVYFNRGDFVLSKERNPSGNLDTLPYPDYEGFNYLERLDSAKSSDEYNYDLFDYPREYPIITSRSCPFACTFCYHPLGEKYRQRSIDSVMKELEYVIPKYRINIVSIYDELFS